MKKTISLLMMIIIVFVSFVYADSGDSEKTYQDGLREGYNEGYKDGASEVYKPREPNVVFEDSLKIPEVNAGGKFNLLIDFKNDSEYSAYHIKITPLFDDVPLVYERPVTFEYDKTLKRNSSATASFGLQTKDNAKNGVYSMKFKVEYKNTSDENFSKTLVTYFKIVGEKINSVVTINNIKTEPERITAGERFTLSFTINNIGEMPMNDTTVKLTGLTADTFMPVDGTDLLYIGTVMANSSVTKSFAMIASDKVTKGNHSIGTMIAYKDADKESINVEKTIYLFDVLSSNEKVEDEDTKVNGKPKIMIESYSTNPTDIVAGDTITFHFRFKNTSRLTYIKNMKITISSAEGALMIANGSNTFYVETLAPQSSLTRSIDLNVKQDLKSKSYPLDIAFDYEDAKGTEYTANEIINIPVVEYSNLVINNAYANEAFVGGQTSLSFDYINMGKAVASNLTASVEGDYETVQEINYIGNLEAGNSDYYDIQVKPTKEGENFGILILTFEDSSGKKIEVKKDFSGYAMVEEAFNENPGDYPYEPIPMEDDIPTYSVWQYIGVGVGSFIVGFFLAKMITTKVVRKKLEDEI